MGELAAHRLLHAKIDGQRERPRSGAGSAQSILKAVLDPREALVLDADVAHEVRGQLALGIDPVPFGAKADAGQAEAHDRTPLLFRQVPLEPDEAARRGQAAEQLVTIDPGQHARQLARRCCGVEHLRRISEQRGFGVVGRDQAATAVDDVGAPRALGRPGDALRVGRGVDRHQGEVDQAQPKGNEGDDEDAADQAQAAARGGQLRVTDHDAEPRPWRPAAAAAVAA